MFVKPCTQKEIDFYEIARAEHERFYDLMPEFMGTVMLADVSSPKPAVLQPSEVVKDHLLEIAAQQIAEKPASLPKDGITWVPNGSKKIPTDKGICLENATFGFKRPNILDTKLGSRLWADDAPLQKKQRFDQITATTTHKDLGFRISGMRVYKGSENHDELNDDQYKIYDKDYGKKHVSTENIVDTFRRFIFNSAAGIDDALGKAVAAVFLQDLERVRDVLEQEESRMYSASLLFVYEGDGEALRDLIEENNAEEEETVRPRRTPAARKVSVSTARVDSGIGDMEADDSESEDDYIPRPWNLKLIDFAHADFLPGQGPDENNLKGVRSLIEIFKQLAD
jgi:inositol-polyphosphate multikinase